MLPFFERQPFISIYYVRQKRLCAFPQAGYGTRNLPSPTVMVNTSVSQPCTNPTLHLTIVETRTITVTSNPTIISLKCSSKPHLLRTVPIPVSTRHFGKIF
uniref:Uncharacterized protein n=1 Tax=Schistocephalus solidus TaxID=70667 RepID=A0A0X3PRN2_SCHSO